MSYSTRTMKPADWAKLKHFTPIEFKEPDKMGYQFMLWLDDLREEADVPMTVSSSYRSPVYNKKVGGAKNSAHTDIPCDSVDIQDVSRKSDPNWNFSRFRIVAAAIKKGCQRIGTYQNGSLHLDMTHDERPAPRMWLVVNGKL